MGQNDTYPQARVLILLVFSVKTTKYPQNPVSKVFNIKQQYEWIFFGVVASVNLKERSSIETWLLHFLIVASFPDAKTSKLKLDILRRIAKLRDVTSIDGSPFAASAFVSNAIECDMEPTAHHPCQLSCVFGMPENLDALMRSNHDALIP